MNKFFKSKIAFGLVLILLVMSLAACGDKGQEETTTAAKTKETIVETSKETVKETESKTQWQRKEGSLKERVVMFLDYRKEKLNIKKNGVQDVKPHEIETLFFDINDEILSKFFLEYTNMKIKHYDSNRLSEEWNKLENKVSVTKDKDDNTVVKVEEEVEFLPNLSSQEKHLAGGTYTFTFNANDELIDYKSESSEEKHFLENLRNNQ